MNKRLHHLPPQPWAAEHPTRQYRPGASLFASPRAVLAARGAKALLPPCTAGRLAGDALAMLRDAGGPGDVIMGAVPFDAAAPARLFVPEQISVGPALATGHAPPAAHRRKPHAVHARPSPDAYRANVERALACIRATGLEKVVLSRSLSLNVQVDLAGLLQRLAARNSRGYTFAIDLVDAPAPRRTLIGASPELLLSRRGRQLLSHPLAGSVPRSSDPREDRRRGAALLESAKDLHEHELVVAAVADSLRPFARQVWVPPRPSLLSTPTMWHLGTEVKAELADPACSSLELALALHPTPAVCGHPLQQARRFIGDVEGFERGYFAGLVGWCDTSGDGEWAVTLRCAEVGEHDATLYAGAGIVDGSVAEDELLETSGKLRTMLAAMGLESVLETMQ
ncbi:isochorismate synthase [Massilia sp. PAMC28688]|uniref:isochorismate synthase n=1 Tax=Massilia sp. PAMC28688 TaxID=2861283 RepID=UPI001C636558|nr:isochorismate synthase [Massilia sp. PAMC28688]QYF95653.1 isochorismate synthase [Massilia sp. PAMC28688]